MLHSLCFVVGACDLPTGESTSSTFSTLIHPFVGANDLVTACLHTLALDTHRCCVRATRHAVNYL